MPLYQVMIRGENFFIRGESGVERLGFYTTRYIEAPSPSDAERCAVDHIRGDARLRSAVLNTQDAPPEIFIEECVEVDPDTVPDAHAGGFTFFPGDADA
jgi:hypothetical protein